ncbi:FYVE, RhoGEF and PH domain-containing protein 5-like isoform X1 [Scomber japonicus]|uniref:FYVE, RhoGEF and PH domain-containing protein 5-like isoform X1 n=1 Tax=Scomber japonicus TaxID=13676 RepID=UPI002305FCCE|nr:FYVE, RhoGEF and PH domain-containing protein 5-like isoform X1 [Scomber japonicus]
MNTDCTKPSVAPKPRFVCHASLKLSSPLMSAARGPKPSIAPKPKVTLELNGRDLFFSGSQGGCINGSSLMTDGEPDQEAENGLNKVTADRLSSLNQFNTCILESPRQDLKNVSQKGLEVAEEEKEEDKSLKMDEDWRLTDSALTEEVDSLETLWVSDAGLTANSEDVVEMVDTDVTEDMDAEGCDAGEALADTDGLSMGDISVNSLDQEAGSYSAEKVPELEDGNTKERQERPQTKEEETGDWTADDLTESLTDEPALLTSENMQDADTQESFLTEGEEKEEEAAPDCNITCNILKLRCGHEIKEMVTNEQNVRFYDFVPEDQKKLCNTTKRHVALDDDQTQEPYYVSSEDVMIPKNNNTHGRPESPLTPHRLLPVTNGGASTGKYQISSKDFMSCEIEENGQKQYVSSENYVEIGHSDKNKVRAYQERVLVRTEEHKAQTVEALLNNLDNNLDYQPRFRLVSISVPADTDTSLTSSLSDSQLLSPNDSDVFRDEDDMEGHIVPFVDDTTDTEQDISDEHVYEDPRYPSGGENIFPFDKRTAGMRSGSLSQRMNNSVNEIGGVQFVQRPCTSGFSHTGPAMSSSPLLSTMRHKSYSKPHYLSLYPRSLSMEGQDMPLSVYKDSEGSPRQRGAICSSGSFSRCSPLSSSGLSTPTSVVDIPPPFELAYITKKPITKSSPSLLIEGDSSEKNRKKKSSIKRFLMLKFRRKTESKSVVDVSPSSLKSSPESGHHIPSRLLDLDSRSISSSPHLNSRSASKGSIEPASSFLFYKESKTKGNSVAFLNRSVVRVESFEDRSRVPFIPLPLTKPRSISFPNTDTSDYENVPAISSDYENLQVPQRRPVRQGPFTAFFDRPTRVLTSANETDGYVDMSSLPGFERKTQSSEQEAESAYTEAYNVCSLAVGPQAGLVVDVKGETAADEDQGRTSEEEDGGGDSNYDRQPDGRSRAFYIAKELVDTERVHVKALKLLQEDFREAVVAAVGDEGEPVLEEERLWEILNELPDVYTLHRRILTELENRIRHWEESQRIADIFLSRKAVFLVFTTYIGHYDRSMNLLEESCRTSPAFAAIVHQFEQSPAGEKVSLKHQLLQVIVRVAQYRMLLTDYLNNLSPDSKEYEDTQAAVVIVSDIADQVNDSLKDGENLLRLVNIEYSVRGQRELLQPGRVFVKEGTLMKVSRKSRQPRHLFLMNDMLLYTYPQQDGKYRLKNTLSLTELKVSKPIIEDVQNALRIEGTDISITLSASSFIEREDWFYTLSRAVTEHTRGSVAFNSSPGEARDRLRLSLGEKAPTLVPVSQVMMCMNCTSDFSLTLRRHHCHGCGRIVCRSCSRNRYPLKYMKDRMAKVCDHCYNELKKRGGDMSVSGKNSPRLNRSSRPLSAVFQNIHPPNIWRHRKGTMSFNQMTVSEEGSISGSLHRSKKSKRNWKRLWFLLKDKVLYTYRAQEEKVASESLPLLGFTVKLPDQQRGEEEANVFQLYHKHTLYYTFKAEDNHTAQRWVNAMEEATVL